MLSVLYSLEIVFRVRKGVFVENKISVIMTVFLYG